MSGRVRGKCRHCTTSVQQARYGWASEDGALDPYDCLAAPDVVCPPCDGIGSFLPEPGTPQAERGERRPCLPCAGTGRVPGPHWPWRHPNPIGA